MKSLKSLAALLLVFTFGLSARADTQGPGDAGGGNSIKGKPIEYYKKDVTGLPEYQKLIMPIFRKIQDQVVNLAHLMEETATHKNWYFVPVALEKLPRQRIGVAFPTEQMALQSMTEIYIDTDLFDAEAMTEKARVILLVHEMVMGAVLRDNEKATRICPKDPEEEYCKKFLRRRGENSSSLLVNRDYEAIRGLTTVIVDMVYNPGSTELAKNILLEVEQHGLEDVFPEQNDSDKYPKVSDLTEVYQILQSRKLDRSIPSYTGFGSGHKATDTCQWAFEYSEGRLNIERTTKYSKTGLTFNSAYTEVFSFSGMVYVKTNNPAPILGDHRFDLILHYSKYSFLKEIELRAHVYVYDEREKSYHWTEIKEWDERGRLSRENSCYYDQTW